jgi:hypothetical protein
VSTPRFDIGDIERVFSISEEEIAAQERLYRQEQLRSALADLTSSPRNNDTLASLLKKEKVKEEIFSQEPLAETNLLLDRLALFPLEDGVREPDLALGGYLLDSAIALGLETRETPHIFVETNSPKMHLRTGYDTPFTLCEMNSNEESFLNSARGSWGDNPKMQCNRCRLALVQYDVSTPLARAAAETLPLELVDPDTKHRLRFVLRKAVQQVVRVSKPEDLFENISTVSRALTSEAITGVLMDRLDEMTDGMVWYEIISPQPSFGRDEHAGIMLLTEALTKKGEAFESLDRDYLEKAIQAALNEGFNQRQKLAIDVAAFHKPKLMKKFYKKNYPGVGHLSLNNALKYMAKRHPHLSKMKLRHRVMEELIENTRIAERTSEYLHFLANKP